MPIRQQKVIEILLAAQRVIHLHQQLKLSVLSDFDAIRTGHMTHEDAMHSSYVAASASNIEPGDVALIASEDRYYSHVQVSNDRRAEKQRLKRKGIVGESAMEVDRQLAEAFAQAKAAPKVKAEPLTCKPDPHADIEADEGDLASKPPGAPVQLLED